MAHTATCPGSGHTPKSSDAAGRSKCPVCGRKITVNRYGSLRRHDDEISALQRADAARHEGERQELTASLVEMRLDAAELKAKLWANWTLTKDPRFKRLWEHALAMENHLSKMHVSNAFDSATEQLRVALARG